MTHRRICFASLAALAGCSTGLSPSEPAARVAVVLTTRTPSVKLGSAPEFEVVLRNDGDAAITLVEPGDGSDCGWRTPIIEWQPNVPTAGRCGNINPLQLGEVFELKPGESRRLSNWVGSPHLPGPGRHAVSVTYRNVPSLEFTGLVLGAHDPEAQRRVRASTPAEATSNVVEIEVVP
jgi:hypothetical protein